MNQPEPKRQSAAPVWITIPTYNEAENLTRLLPLLFSVAPNATVVVVDDGSPDGTGDTVRRFAAEGFNVRLIQRGGLQGYSSAVRTGLRHALENGAELLMHMDADLSHHPRYVPDLLALMEQGAQVAVGSRYVPGGGTLHWTLSRRALSYGANLLARGLLRLPLKDCTGGFRCYRAEVVRQSGLLETRTEGYAFLMATACALHRGGWQVREAPIIFEDRQCGQSKLSKRIIFEAALVMLRLLWTGESYR